MDERTTPPMITMPRLPGDPSEMEIIACDEYIRLSAPQEQNEAYEYARLTWGDELFPPYM